MIFSDEALLNEELLQESLIGKELLIAEEDDDMLVRNNVIVIVEDKSVDDHLKAGVSYTVDNVTIVGAYYRLFLLSNQSLIYASMSKDVFVRVVSFVNGEPATAYDLVQIDGCVATFSAQNVNTIAETEIPLTADETDLAAQGFSQLGNALLCNIAGKFRLTLKTRVANQAATRTAVYIALKCGDEIYICERIHGTEQLQQDIITESVDVIVGTNATISLISLRLGDAGDTNIDASSSLTIKRL